jgi:hypothetical protein
VDVPTHRKAIAIRAQRMPGGVVYVPPPTPTKSCDHQAPASYVPRLLHTMFACRTEHSGMASVRDQLRLLPNGYIEKTSTHDLLVQAACPHETYVWMTAARTTSPPPTPPTGDDSGGRI